MRTSYNICTQLLTFVQAKVQKRLINHKHCHGNNQKEQTECETHGTLTSIISSPICCCQRKQYLTEFELRILSGAKLGIAGHTTLSYYIILLPDFSCSHDYFSVSNTERPFIKGIQVNTRKSYSQRLQLQIHVHVTVQPV